MSSRFMTVLLLSILSCCLIGCKSSKEEQVITWLKRMPENPSDAQKKWGVVAYSTSQEWSDAGRRIEGIEKILIGLLDHPPKELSSPTTLPVKTQVVYALGFVGSSNCVPVLIEVLEDKKEFVWTRVHAATALGSIGDPLAKAPLCRIVSCGEELETLRINAIGGLWMIGDPNVVPVIENALKNKHFDTYKKSALKMLEELRQKKGKERNKSITYWKLVNREC